jgi:16S rRNA (uracil1498-N3)-methyltransferase
MTAPRFVIASSCIEGPIVRIRGAELRHMRVMRLRAGAEVMLIDELGVTHSGHMLKLDSREARVELSPPAQSQPKAARTETAPPLILAAAIIKGPRMDFLVEKAAEIGAVALWPLKLSRALIREPGGERLARWRRLAQAAAKQSLSTQVMDVRPPIAMHDLIEAAPRDMLAIICQPGAPALQEVIGDAAPRGVLIACGPEGGFSADELGMAEAAGFRSAGLGDKRLRSETAAIVALALAGAALRAQNRGERD